MPSHPNSIKGEYLHFKGKKYELIDIAIHSETLEEYVVYKPLYPSSHPLWIRPSSLFFGLIETETGKIPRFKKIE